MHSEESQAIKVGIGSTKILVVDDEPGIRRSLLGAFSDEGFKVVAAESADAALEKLNEFSPDLVFLDIWMPGTDGLQALAEIKKRFPSLPVIVMSGHANISIAVKATQEGAFDFVEKPLDLSNVLNLVRRALSQKQAKKDPLTASGSGEFSDPEYDKRFLESTSSSVKNSLNKVVASTAHLAQGLSIPQKTLAASAGLFGQGLHSGNKSGIMLEPLPVNSGIHFIGIHAKEAVPAHIDFVESTGYATTLRLGGTQVGTIEHLMSALNAYGITNLLIKCNNEIPVMDGSASEFCALIEQTGVVTQDASINTLAVKDCVKVGNDQEYIMAEPSDGFTIDYTLKYPNPVGEQHMVFKLGSIDSYRQEIAPARTFGFVKDIGWLQRQGLAQGGRFDNFVLFGETGPINCELRFKDEAVRHKILDAIGDLYLLGRPLQAKITACMTGHSDNIALLKALKEKLLLH